MPANDSIKYLDGWTRTEKLCQSCGDKFYVRTCALKKRPWEFCSRACYYARPFDEANFWRRVDKSGGPDACWPWTGPVFGAGYGQASFHGRMHNCHHIAWTITHGPVPKGLLLRHFVCGNPKCCNPSHLRTGTHADNKADSVRDGTYVHGTRNPRAIFTDEIILEMRILWAQGKSQKFICEQFKADSGSVCKIVHGKQWKHVKMAQSGTLPSIQDRSMDSTVAVQHLLQL